MFSLCVATIGFLAFALVLALVEQAFLEGLEQVRPHHTSSFPANKASYFFKTRFSGCVQNVRVGSKVLETGHFLLLAFGRSPRDREMLLTISRQVHPICLPVHDSAFPRTSGSFWLFLG